MRNCEFPYKCDCLECPKCGQRAIVRLSKIDYRCISCGFKRDFSKEDKEEKDDNNGMGFFFFLIAGVTLLLML